MKKLTALFASFVLAAVLFVLPSQAADIGEIDKPYMIQYVVRSDGKNERVTISCAVTDDFAALSGDEQVLAQNGLNYAYGFMQLDYRIDGGEWQYTSEWDTNPSASFYGSAMNIGETVKTLDLLYLVNDTAVKEAGELVKVSDDGSRSFDLENHSLEVRLRAVVNCVAGAESFYDFSDWTEAIRIERDVASPEIPMDFEAPIVSDERVEHMADTDMPYITFRVKTPESIKEAQTIHATHGNSGIALVAYIDIGEGWQQVSLSSSGSFFSNETKHIYLDGAVFDDEKPAKIKLCYMTYDKNNNQIFSEESQIIKLILPRWKEGKGILPAKCTTCGICTPLFGKACMFIVFGIAAAVIIVAAIIAKIQLDKARVRKAEAEEERQRKLEAERAAYNARKQQNKQKNRK